MKKLINILNPQKHIMLKIWLASVSIALSSLLAAGLCLQLFFKNFFLENTLSHAENNAAATASAFETTYNHIIRQFINSCGTASFQELFPKLISSNKIEQSQVTQSVQTLLRNIIQCNSLIESALFINSCDTVFLPVGESLNNSIDYQIAFPAEKTNGITMQKTRISPIKNEGQILPIAIPLTYLGKTTYPAVASDSASAECTLCIFLDVSDVNAYLRLYNTTFSKGTQFIVSEKGSILNYSDNELRIQNINENELSAVINTQLSSGNCDSSVPYKDYYLIFQKIGNKPLYLVNMITKDTLLSTYRSIQSFLLYAACISVLLISLVALSVAANITRPLKRLMLAVFSISNGSYSSEYVLSQQDEIGQLSRAIDSMYHTILVQVKELDDERQETANAQIRLFAEQINPHFLYNTLEYINMEVYNHHNESASKMIQDLGDFLRIGLNLGSDITTISHEIDHVQAYINIMNHRFHHHISFICSVEESLLSHEILKLILQPLAENSIRHGFLMDESNSYLEVPTITLQIYQKDNYLYISVIDNGIGIDIEKAEKTIKDTASAHKHIGLNNIYKRLKVFYNGDAEITFESIPYYKNTVCIRIPMYMHHSDSTVRI